MTGNRVRMLALSLTGECNFACKYCYASEHDRSRMNIDTAIKALRLTNGMNDKFILQFTGGEPLLNYECLKQVVEYVTDKKISAIMQLQTNGSLLNDENAKFLYRNKVAIGVSLDGKPQVNDKLRLRKDGSGATNDILQGIEVLKRNNIATGITCVVTEDNVSELEGIVEFAYFLGNVRRIGFDLLRGQGRGTGLKAPCAGKLELAMKKVHDKSLLMERLTGLKIPIAQVERVNKLEQNRDLCFGHCYAMNVEAAFVDPAGDIYACSSLVGDKKFYLGNVDNGINKVLQDKVSLEIKRSMNFCHACKDFALCGGGCFSRWYGSGCKTEYPGECALKRAVIEWYKKKL
ncbi:MAG: radical SAM protein [Negativicutes bacterium]|nr:radical SAM protein [Negativicutes bacterium]